MDNNKTKEELLEESHREFSAEMIKSMLSPYPTEFRSQKTIRHIYSYTKRDKSPSKKKRLMAKKSKKINRGKKSPKKRKR